MMYDVAIIGCGIIGAATAYELSRYDLKVVALEAENDVANGTTKANSAILHAGYDPEPGTLMARLNVRGVELARELCQKLDVPYRPCGSLVLAFSEEERPALEELYRRGQANGVPGLKLLDGEVARSLEPNLSDEVAAALHAPSAAICSPWEYCLALAETAVKNGAELHLNTAVTGLERTSGGWTVRTTTGDFEARFVLNAAGVDAAGVHDLAAAGVHDLAAPHSFDIRPARGQYYLLDKSEGGRVSRVIFQCPSAAGKGVLVAPTVHGNLIVGPNAEGVDKADDVNNTAGGLAFVRRMSVKSVPGVNFRDSIRNFAGVRANSDQPDFIIEESPAAKGFINLGGIKSPGLSSAPAIALEAVELLKKSGLAATAKENFVDTRKRVVFRHLSAGEKARLVKENPLYGRVICRCETVTEGEIVEAIHRPIVPRSIDGIKRRCNAGMGRCQGGFCGPRVHEILSRELGLPLDQVLMDEDGSYILTQPTKEGK